MTTIMLSIPVLYDYYNVINTTVIAEAHKATAPLKDQHGSATQQ